MDLGFLNLKAIRECQFGPGMGVEAMGHGKDAHLGLGLRGGQVRPFGPTSFLPLVSSSIDPLDHFLHSSSSHVTNIIFVLLLTIRPSELQILDKKVTHYKNNIYRFFFFFFKFWSSNIWEFLIQTKYLNKVKNWNYESRYNNGELKSTPMSK